MSEMRALTVRIPEELHSNLQAVSLAERRSMAEIVRSCIVDYTESQPLDEIKELIAAARSLGPVSRERALAAAERAAELDTSEGIGEPRMSRG